MQQIKFSDADTHTVALLFKNGAMNKYEISSRYLEEMAHIKDEEVVAYSLAYNDNNKAPASLIKSYLKDELMPELKDCGVQFIYCSDVAYFKVLSGRSNTKGAMGYVFPCVLEGYSHMQVVLGFNYQQLAYDPSLSPRLGVTVATLDSLVAGLYQPPGAGALEEAVILTEPGEIAEALTALHEYDRLGVDIEAFSLRVTDAGVGTISFAISKHVAMAFPVDYSPREERLVEAEKAAKVWNGFYGYQVPNPELRKVLRRFFEDYQGTMVWHNATYDLRCIIWALFMEDPLDYEGMLYGLEVMTRNFEDTKIIAYLATNSTAGNELGLKHLAHNHAGDYAVEVKDIRTVPQDKLLNYNCYDTISTLYVFEEYYPQMVAAGQEELYLGLMKESVVSIIQTELVGMPLDMEKVAVAKKELEEELKIHMSKLSQNPLIREFNITLQEQAMHAANAKLKKKVKPIDDFASVVFNPNSGPQTQQLLYKVFGLPVLDLTKSKQPATGNKTLKKLVNHTTCPDQIEVIEALLGVTKVAKILTAFIPTFEKAYLKDNGLHYLHGNFNLGGTVSGRLSSDKPNLQQMPSGSQYGKLIKDCFRAPEGWIMCGADFHSLEDYISALTTKDPNKLAVYLRGYDGHSLRAANYFRDELPHIDLDDPDSVNTIKKEHDDLRSASKAPTFLLTYGGTYHGMMKNLGWTKEKSQTIEAAYHDMYKVSDDWVQSKLDGASKVGYVEAAFGLKVRTPLLATTLRNHDSTPWEAQAEGRTAGNALGQSYGLLNNRAQNEFLRRVWASPYRLDIMPIALIHDAIYLLVRDKVEVIKWANDNLIECMEWQELPEIQHDEVKLGAELDLFWPSWKHALTLKNNMSESQIIDACQDHIVHLEEEGYLEAS